ncbi:cellulose binding domain-containing protein [Streptomyces sp. NPDC004546]|uniref:cellulose binding domain-containing protein n=1 Tax=Streptomyces sp. NPDC004546 TaxID=3154282 RepID=UPI0033A83761
MSRRRRTSSHRIRNTVVSLLSVSLLAVGGTALYSLWRPFGHDAPVLTVRYRTGDRATTDVARPWLEIINTSGRTVDLSDVTLRYYYADADGSAYASNCVQTALGCSVLTLRTQPASTPAPGADHYLQVGFTAAAGSLAPGKSTQGIGLQLYRVDHQPLHQGNDRSFDATDTTYTRSTRVTAYVRGDRVWGEDPGGGTPAPARQTSVAPAPPEDVLFDDFRYTGPGDPALAAHGWEARGGQGGPGVQDSWSPQGVSFPAAEAGAGNQALQLRATTDGTAQGTRQAEFHRTEPAVRTGTLVARVHFSDTPTSGSDGDHVAQSFFTISPDHASKKYSELDYEYTPNGGWGRFGPRLDTTSWRSSVRGDRVTRSHPLKLDGWHTMVITTVDGTTTYAVDGRELFTSGSRYGPREPMTVNFSTWFIDLAFKGAPRTWGMQVDWLYYQSGRTISAQAAQKAVAGFAAAGIPYVDTLPGR